MRIINDCTGYPPFLLAHIRRSMRWIDPMDLKGIDCIKLWSELPELTDQAPTSIRDAKQNGYKVCGLYKPVSNNNSPFIILLIKDIYRGVPFFYCCTPVPTLLITRVLAHEVAHHLVATRGYVFKKGEKLNKDEHEEELAEKYSFNVLRRMLGHWQYRFGYRLILDLAENHYILGMHDWNDKKYDRAAEHWYIAQNLNPNDELATYWYWRAKAMISS
jgi:hypothetical protein